MERFSPISEPFHISLNALNRLIKERLKPSKPLVMEIKIAGKTVTLTKVVRVPSRTLLVEEVQGFQVPRGQVDDVDVVADTGTILRVVLVAEDGQALPLSDSDLHVFQRQGGIAEGGMKYTGRRG